MNKIGWCDMTWNPVWGCLNNCEYCYARKMAKRFALKMTDIEGYHLDYESLYEFKPTFLESQFDKKFPKKPQRIFVGSMSEIYYWGDLWMSKILGKIKEYPQHTFQFLTKHPQIYFNYNFPKNCWLGVTITRNASMDFVSFQQFAYRDSDNVKYISFEPLLNEITFLNIQKYFDWVIIGAETGNRKGKVIPNLDWVLEIVRYCELYKIPIYIKDNLVKYYAGCRGYKQFPIGR